MKLSELKKIIRSVVREEITAVVPEVIAETLSERYLSKLLSERAPEPKRRPAPAKTRSLRSVLEVHDEPEDDDWQEQVPEPPEDDHEGIYNDVPLARGNGSRAANESARARLRESVLGDVEFPVDPRSATQAPVVPGLPSDFFEGTRPVTEAMVQTGDTQSTFGEEGVPLDFLSNVLKIDNGFGAKAVQRKTQASQETIDESRLKVLEQRRKSLERPV